jgi:hypothetical protein
MEIMGDGVHAIFNGNIEGEPGTACRQAFEAAKEGIEALARSNRSQPEDRVPRCQFCWERL